MGSIYWTEREKNQLGPVDRAATATQKRSFLRVEEEMQRQKRHQKEIQEAMEVQPSSSIEHSGTESEDSGSDTEFVPDVNSEIIENEQNRYKYNELPIVADRYCVSSRASAAIVNAALKDMGLLNNQNMLDRKKIEREKNRIGHKNVEISKSGNIELKCLGFDGRKDETLHKHGMEKEDHYVLVNEPGGYYLDHFTPDQGNARSIANEIFTFIIDYKSLDSLDAVLCDGTSVNTGRNAGVIKLLELYLGRSLQWLVCLLHMNELPFRHLFEKIDGPTLGPDTLKGCIGKQLKKDLSNLDIVKFSLVKGKIEEIPECVIKQLSSDQKYLYEICIAVQSGHITESLARRSQGNLHNARWLTRANRILRLYVSTPDPSNNLKEVVNIILNLYAPGWFYIKSHPKATDGARIFFHLITLAKELKPDHRKIVQPVFFNNSYFANSESILLSMLTDYRLPVREKALQKIIFSRTVFNGMRNFELPRTLNLDAMDYTEMIDWELEKITQPPLIRQFTNDMLINIRKKPLEISDIPCHSQNVERAVSLVTKASENRIGYFNRHRFILNRLDSRKRLCSFEWKGQWKL